MSKTKIPHFNNLEELNVWIRSQFHFDGDNPLQDLLEDYVNSRDKLCKIHNLITFWETHGVSEEPECPEELEESKEPGRSEVPVNVGIVNFTDYDSFKLRNGDGQEKELQIKLVEWDQEPFLSINLETGCPEDMVLFIPSRIYAHELALILEKTVAKLAAEYGLTVVNKAS
ncbi:MAG: hypothetical protein ACYDEQ_07615 [Desulfocucumaceae bacterium]